jgi:prepilin-type N-terminal cleavage/methylation domain-containing protein
MTKIFYNPASRGRFCRKASSGFSLVELVIVLIILGILASSGALVISRGFNAYFAGRDMTRADWQGRIALERMTRDLREVRTQTASDITTMAANQITYNDIFLNNITYSLVGTTMTRTQSGVGASGLADFVSALNLSYWQRNGQSAAGSAAQVCYITVQITVQPTITGVNNAAPVTYHDTVKPRSFGSC